MRRAVLNCPSMAARFLTLLLCVCTALVRGQNSNTARPDFWAADAPVRTIVEANGLLYLGGDFHYLGWNAGGGWSIDTNGVPAPALPKIDGRVLTIVDDAAGG